MMRPPRWNVILFLISKELWNGDFVLGDILLDLFNCDLALVSFRVRKSVRKVEAAEVA